LAGVGELVAGFGEPVGVCAGLDDVAAEGEPVDDGGAEPWVGEGLGPGREGFVRGYGDGGFLLALSENLEEQLSAALVQLECPVFSGQARLRLIHAASCRSSNSMRA
jgi:hypothetical protein